MEASDAARIFAALAQGSRLDIMRLLMEQGPNGLPAGEIADRLGVPARPPRSISPRSSAPGWSPATRQGRQIMYAARVRRVARAAGFLTETCCGGRPELCGDLAAAAPADLPKRTPP